MQEDVLINFIMLVVHWIMPRDVTFMHTWEPSLDAPNATSQADLDSTLPQSATRENKDVATMWTMYAFWIQSVFTCPTINNNIVWILPLSLSLWLSSRGTPSCCPDLASDRVSPRLDITLGNLGPRVDYSEDLRGSFDYRPTGCRWRSVTRSLCAAYGCEETGLLHILKCIDEHLFRGTIQDKKVQEPLVNAECLFLIRSCHQMTFVTISTVKQSKPAINGSIE